MYYIDKKEPKDNFDYYMSISLRAMKFFYDMDDRYYHQPGVIEAITVCGAVYLDIATLPIKFGYRLIRPNKFKQIVDLNSNNNADNLENNNALIYKPRRK